MANCANHPKETVVGSCRRCGQFACDKCLTHEPYSLCETCLSIIELDGLQDRCQCPKCSENLTIGYNVNTIGHIFLDLFTVNHWFPKHLIPATVNLSFLERVGRIFYFLTGQSYFEVNHCKACELITLHYDRLYTGGEIRRKLDQGKWTTYNCVECGGETELGFSNIGNAGVYWTPEQMRKWFSFGFNYMLIGNSFWTSLKFSLSDQAGDLVPAYLCKTCPVYILRCQIRINRPEVKTFLKEFEYPS